MNHPPAEGARLHASPDNPVPEDAVPGLLMSRDGLPLRYALFRAGAGASRGTVVVLPGRNECIEKYFETIGDLAGRGFGVAIMDWRGQGGSARLIRDPLRGYVDSFDDYVRDLDTFFDEVVLPDCRGPFYVLAHSTGALVALLAAPGLVNRVRRMVLSAPLIEFSGLPVSMATAGRLAGALFALGFGGTYFGARRPREAIPFADNRLTSDPARYARNQGIYATTPSLGLAGPTVAWVRAACLAAAAVREPQFAARILVPTLIVTAGADTVVSTPATERYARALRSATALAVDGARHELLQEADPFREQFLAAFDAFVPGSAAD